MPSFFSSREGSSAGPNRLKKTTNTITSTRASSDDGPITTPAVPTSVAAMQKHRSILKKSKTVAAGVEEEEGSSQQAEPRRSFVSFTRSSRASSISVASSTATITKDNYKNHNNSSSNTKLQRSDSWKRRFGLNNILTRGGGSSSGGGGKNRSSITTTTTTATSTTSTSSVSGSTSSGTPTTTTNTSTTQGNVSIGDGGRHQSAGVGRSVGVPMAQGQIHHLHPSSNRSSFSSARPAVAQTSSSLSAVERLSKPRQSQTTASTLKRTPSPSSLAVASTTAVSSRAPSTSSRLPFGSSRRSTVTTSTTANNSNNNSKGSPRLAINSKAALLPPVVASPPLELSLLPLPDTGSDIDLVPAQSIITTEVVQTQKQQQQQKKVQVEINDNKNTTSKSLTTTTTSTSATTTPITIAETNTTEEMPTTTSTVTTTTQKSMPPIIPDTLTVDMHPAMATTSAKFSARTSSLPQSTATTTMTSAYPSPIDLSKPTTTELSTQLSYYITPTTTPTPDALTATAALPPSVMRPGPSTPPLTEDSGSSKSSTKLSIHTNTEPYSRGPPTPASSSASSTNLTTGKRVNFADPASSSPAPPRQQRPANFQRPPQRPPSPIHMPAPDLTRHKWAPLLTTQLDCAADHTWAPFRNKQHSILCAICHAMEFEGRGVPVKRSYYCTWCAVRLCGGCKENLGNCEGGLRELWEKMEEIRAENLIAVKEGRGMETSKAVVRVEKEVAVVPGPPPIPQEPKRITPADRRNTAPVQSQGQGQRRLAIEAAQPPPPPPVQRTSSMPPPQRLNTKSPRPIQPPQSQARPQPTRPRQASSNIPPIPQSRTPPPHQESRTPPPLRQQSRTPPLRQQSRTPPPRQQSRTPQPQSRAPQAQSRAPQSQSPPQQQSTSSKAPQLPETYRITPVESESKPATVVLVEKQKAPSIAAASLKSKKKGWFRGFGKKKEEA